MAAALAASVPPELLPLAAGAYRDGTRVAGSDAALWAGIFLENRRPVLEALDRFEAQLAAFRARPGGRRRGRPDRLVGRGRRSDALRFEQRPEFARRRGSSRDSLPV